MLISVKNSTAKLIFFSPKDVQLIFRQLQKKKWQIIKTF